LRILNPALDPLVYMPDGGGILLVNKPLGWTSFDVVNKIRFALGRRLNEKRPKVGHAGTLDPLATGLLVICVGKYTKQIDTFQAEQKVYSGHFVLGAMTPSYDRETPVEQLKPIETIDLTALERVRDTFLGKLAQYPPMYSAVKMDGKKLYEVARAGKTLELETRPVEIYSFELGTPETIRPGDKAEVLLKPTVRYLPEEHGVRLPFRVVCSKGTYIRSLAHDFGQTLGCGAYLGSLQRDQSGHFGLQDAYSVEEWVAGLGAVSHI
jgi:tRNA pseudouridine55 synthase